jgi:hypothetical protein
VYAIAYREKGKRAWRLANYKAGGRSKAEKSAEAIRLQEAFLDQETDVAVFTEREWDAIERGETWPIKALRRSRKKKRKSKSSHTQLPGRPLGQ